MAFRKHDGGDEAVHSGAVLDRDGPTPAGAQLFREQAGGDIGARADTERQDEFDSSLRPVSLGCVGASAGMQHIKLATVSHRRAGNCVTFTSRTIAAMAPFVFTR